MGYKVGNILFTAPKEDSALAKQYETLFTAIKKGKDIDVYAPEYNIPQPENIAGKTYEAAHVSTGPLLTTVSAKIIPNSHKVLINDKNESVNKTHKVLFYAQNDSLLGLGTITNISHPSETKTEIEYSFDDLNLAQLDKESFNPLVDILIHETGPVKRVLHSSIIKKGDENYIYVAKARRDDLGVAIIEPNGKTIAAAITKQPINTHRQDDLYVAANDNIHPVDLVLLNPDENLTDGQMVKLKIMEIKAMTSSVKTQAWLNKIKRETAQSTKHWKTLTASCNLEAAANAAKIPNKGDEKSSSNCGGGGSGGCGAASSTEAPDTASEDTPAQQSSTVIDAYQLLGVERPTQFLESTAPQE